MSTDKDGMITQVTGTKIDPFYSKSRGFALLMVFLYRLVEPAVRGYLAHLSHTQAGS